MTPLQLLGLLGVFAVARFALSSKPFRGSGPHGSAVGVVREYLDALIVAGLAALLLITFVIRTYYIPSISMIPTLTVHDVLLADQIAYRFGRPRSGDVAVFIPPIPSEGNAFVKRVIGVPGDTIRIADGIVYRNGNALTEPYENQQPKYDLEIKNYAIYVDGQPLDPKAADVPPRRFWQTANRIPAGYYFMLGDNRNYSDDSHVWGFARGRSFTGRAFFIIWPFGRIRALK